MSEVMTAGDEGVPAQSAAAKAAKAAREAGSDDRLAHRGPFQRLLMQPEVGAVIGAVALWSFFWAVTQKFGTAAGAQGVLDVSATLGIMAVAVAMLMIGGEFDLSSGALTGATGLLTIYLALEVGELGGAGLNLWIAIPLSLVFALAVGWFNGTMVERTGLPSFIVTLASFFILKGVKLGFAKLLVDQIQVGPIPQEGNGYEFWRKVFAATWDRNDHQLGSRDFLYSSLVLLGVAVIVASPFIMNFRRRSSLDSSGVGMFVIGSLVAVGGYIQLHNTDGVTNNTIWGLLLGVGVLVALVGLTQAVALPASEPAGSLALPRPVLQPLLTGAGLMVLGVLSARLLNSNVEDRVFLLLTEQGLRALLFVGLSAGGILLVAIAAFRAGFASRTSRSFVLLVGAGLVVWLAYMVQVESFSVKFRTELFSVMLVGALLMATWAVVSLRHDVRREVDVFADRLGVRLVAAGLTMIFVGVVIRLLYTSEEEIAAGIPPAQFSVRILWFFAVTALATWVLARTRFGGWTFAVGGNKDAARQVGVPAARTKTQLFMVVSAAAWLVGMLLAFRLNTLQAGTGDGLEFEYIIAAVVGGNLLSGGYGSAFGAAIGALIMAMSKQGIPFALWNSDWRFVFLGVILLLAAIGNSFIKNKAENLRKA